jgi:2-hydroxychromene-2-carboxylate isomerase
MRAAVHAHYECRGERFAREAFRVSFLDGLPLSEEASIALALERSGLDAAAGLEAIGDGAVKARLRKNTDEAIEAGVVGVPSVRLGDRVFWGDDRLEEALAARDEALARERSGETEDVTGPGRTPG